MRGRRRRCGRARAAALACVRDAAAVAATPLPKGGQMARMAKEQAMARAVQAAFAVLTQGGAGTQSGRMSGRLAREAWEEALAEAVGDRLARWPSVCACA